MILVFCLGIFLGRGHNLESRLPALGRFMPDSALPVPPLIIDANTPAPMDADLAARQRQSERTDDPAAKSGENVDPRTQVMGQADLGYRDNLKDPERQQNAPGNRTAPKERAGEQTKQAGATKSAQSGGVRQTAQAPSGKTTAQTAPLGASAPASAQNDQVYHYTYQAAAYKDQPSCDKFAEKLKSAGFRARTEKTVDGKGQDWFRVMIDFTGTPDGTDALREKLKNHGVPRVLLKAKTPARP
jgi:cell division protein FtsN